MAKNKALKLEQLEIIKQYSEKNYVSKSNVGEGLEIDENGNLNVTGKGLTIDSELSETSENPVQNKVVTAALNNKADKSEIPTSLPANGGNADTVNNYRIADELTPYPGELPETVYTDVARINHTSKMIYNYDTSKIKVGYADESAYAADADTVDGLHANEIANNLNLLTNPDFSINQRGTTSAANNNYAVDRWAGYYSVNSDKSITISANANVHQDNDSSLVSIGNTYTISVGLSDGTIVSASGEMKSGTSWNINKWIDNLFLGVRFISSDMNIFRTQISTNSNGSVSIKWVKLEQGVVATPFIPPEPTLELLKCQRYYQIRSTNNIAAVDLRPSMLEGVNPTITALSDGNYSYSTEL